MSDLRLLETVIYVSDLEAAEAFYARVLGLIPQAKVVGRHLFYKLGEQMLLVFDPKAASIPGILAGQVLPPHGAAGPCHVCFRATPSELDSWRAKLALAGVPVESEVVWPQGGRSLYFRDPSGNAFEFAEPRIWGI